MNSQLTRFLPFSDLARFDASHGVEDFFKHLHFKHALRDFSADFQIKMDVSETEQAYSVKAELPGIKKEHIRIEVDGRQVLISAESKQERDQKEGHTVVCSERYVGQMCRSFTLPQEIDEEKVVAKYEDGVLALSLPKKSAGSGKKIPVT